MAYRVEESLRKGVGLWAFATFGSVFILLRYFCRGTGGVFVDEVRFGCEADCSVGRGGDVGVLGGEK